MLLLGRLDPDPSLPSVSIHEAILTQGEITRTLAVWAPDWAPSTSKIVRTSAASFIDGWEAVDEPASRASAPASVGRTP